MPTCSCPRARESRSVYGPFGAHVRAPRSIRIPSPFSARSSPCHRRDKACPLTARTESARIGFDAAFRVHLSTSACRRHRNNVRSRVIARRSSRRVEHWGREFLLCIAIAPASPRGVVFAISPLAERNFWSRTRARSHEQELIAQPSSTTSRTRRGSFSASAALHTLRHEQLGPQNLTIRPCSKPRASCWSPFDAQPLARVLVHAFLSEAAQACRITFGMIRFARSRLRTRQCSRRRPSVLTVQQPRLRVAFEQV